MRKAWFGFWCSLSLALPAFAVPTSFLSSEIQRADRTTLERLVQFRGDSSATSQLQGAIANLALADLDRESDLPHAAWERFRAVEGFCESRRSGVCAFTGQDRARAAAVCAFAAGERMASQSWPIFWRTARRLKADITQFQTEDLGENERLFLTGRLRTELSPPYGQDFRSSLVSWRILERLAPTTPGLAFFLGRTFFLQGNTRLAQGSFDQAEEAHDARAILRAKRLGSGPDDEASFGVSPWLASSPAQGVALGIRAWDDRILDTRRGGKLVGYFTTRAGWGATATLWDGATLGPGFVSVEGSVGQESSDAFAAGMNPAVGQGFRLFRARGQGRAGVRAGAWEASLLAEYRLERADSVPVAFPVSSGTALGGRVAWDGRDRLGDPRSGLRVWVQPLWWTEAQALRVSWQGEWHLPIASAHLFSVHAAGVMGSGALSWNLQPDLYGTGVPGVRRYRYVEANTLAFWARYRYRLFSVLRVGMFGAAGSAAPTGTALFSSLRFGAGVDMEFLLERAPRWLPRWEVAFFNSEWIFQGGMRVEL